MVSGSSWSMTYVSVGPAFKCLLTVPFITLNAGQYSVILKHSKSVFEITSFLASNL